MIDTNFDDLVQQLAARRDQLQAELDAAMDAHGVICRAHDLLAGTATIVTAKAAEQSTAGLCLCTTTKEGVVFTCNRATGHTHEHLQRNGFGVVVAAWPQ